MLRQLARRLSTSPTVVTSRAAGPIAVLSVDDGKANAFTQPMVEQLNSALDDCTDAGAVVIVGNAKALSAGFDLNVMSDALSGRALDVLRQCVAIEVEGSGSGDEDLSGVKDAQGLAGVLRALS